VQFSPFVNLADVQGVRLKTSRLIIWKVTHFRKKCLKEKFRGFERKIIRRFYLFFSYTFSLRIFIPRLKERNFYGKHFFYQTSF
jgi:hypothetical protein